MTNTFRHLFAACAIIAVSGTIAFALTAEDIAARYQGQGYTHIEIKQGLTQTKLEAIRGTEKLEILFDRATGAILKSEIERARPHEIGRNGVVVRDRARDFECTDRSSRDRSDDSGRGRGRGSDDDQDDDQGSRGRGSDDN